MARHLHGPESQGMCLGIFLVQRGDVKSKRFATICRSAECLIFCYLVRGGIPGKRLPGMTGSAT
jgi:hypothetical protein